jgi:DNA polymerase III delta prime subunit
MPPADAELYTTALQIAAEQGIVTNKLLAARLPRRQQQDLSWARIRLTEAGLLEIISEAESEITPSGRDFIAREVPITPDLIRQLRGRMSAKTAAVQAAVPRAKEELKAERRIKMPDGSLPLNLILYGPPGTGKTRKILEEYVPRFDDGSVRRYEMVTFHPSYSYEEFVEGLRPVILQREKQDSSNTSDDVSTEADATIRETVDVVHCEVVPGVFRRICKRAARDPDSRYALFIDEINRGNVPALFGELITLIEEDKRGKEVTLAYSPPRQRSHAGLSSATSEIDEEHRFSVPPNLHIIGTMNTADRSIALVDVALRRRFEFEEIGVDYDALKKALTPVEELKELDVVKMLQRINDRICYLYDRDHQIRQGWLIGARSLDDLRKVFYHKIIPLLTEYFYDDWSKVCFVLGELPEQTRATDLIKKKKLLHKNLFGSAQDVGKDKWIYSVSDHKTWTANHFAKISEAPASE